MKNDAKYWINSLFTVARNMENEKPRPSSRIDVLIETGQFLAEQEAEIVQLREKLFSAHVYAYVLAGMSRKDAEERVCGEEAA